MTLKVLKSQEEVAQRVGELRNEISRDYRGRKPLVIGVLTGAYKFVADLTTGLLLPFDIGFVKAKSYSGTESTGKIGLELDIAAERVKNRDVILVEDIVDTGLTLSYLMACLKDKEPHSLALCAFLNKAERRKPDHVGLAIDYLGFEIPDVFVVGYGIDFEEQYRGLPYIGYLER